MLTQKLEFFLEKKASAHSKSVHTRFFRWFVCGEGGRDFYVFELEVVQAFDVVQYLVLW
jgi:hypothetical protein